MKSACSLLTGTAQLPLTAFQPARSRLFAKRHPFPAAKTTVACPADGRRVLTISYQHALLLEMHTSTARLRARDTPPQAPAAPLAGTPIAYDAPYISDGIPGGDPEGSPAHHYRALIAPTL